MTVALRNVVSYFGIRIWTIIHDFRNSNSTFYVSIPNSVRLSISSSLLGTFIVFVCFCGRRKGKGGWKEVGFCNGALRQSLFASVALMLRTMRPSGGALEMFLLLFCLSSFGVIQFVAGFDGAHPRRATSRHCCEWVYWCDWEYGKVDKILMTVLYDRLGFYCNSERWAFLPVFRAINNTQNNTKYTITISLSFNINSANRHSELLRTLVFFCKRSHDLPPQAPASMVSSMLSAGRRARRCL